MPVSRTISNLTLDRLEPAPLRDVAGWVEQYRKLWEERLDRLDDFLHELQAHERRTDGPRTP
jgi:hypothetical protein